MHDAEQATRVTKVGPRVARSQPLCPDGSLPTAHSHPPTPTGPSLTRDDIAPHGAAALASSSGSARRRAARVDPRLSPAALASSPHARRGACGPDRPTRPAACRRRCVPPRCSKRAASRALPISAVVANVGCIQPYTGAVKHGRHGRPVVNVLDERFNLHVHSDRIAGAYVVSGADARRRRHDPRAHRRGRQDEPRVARHPNHQRGRARHLARAQSGPSLRCRRHNMKLCKSALRMRGARRSVGVAADCRPAGARKSLQGEASGFS